MKVYGAGGAGINIAARLESLRSATSGVTMEPVDVSYIDTSSSNVHHNKVDADNLYIIETDSETKGAGKKRDDVYVPVQEQVRRILLGHEPQEFNCIINSLSGGSGSVIGPLLHKEMQHMGHNVVSIIIGSSDSSIEIQNTMKTLEMYMKISAETKAPVVVIYFENCKETPRSSVDEKVVTSVGLLSAIFSHNNQEMDGADITNFLHYDRVTDHEPNLVVAKFLSPEIDLPESQYPIACLTLALPGEDTSTGMPVDYQAVGFVSHVEDTVLANVLPLHFAIVDGYIVSVYAKFQKKIRDLKMRRDAAVIKRIQVKDE